MSPAVEHEAKGPGTRRLFLLRHAKSSWDDPSLADHDRPLADRGRRASKLIAEYLSREGIIPSLVLCSSAARARETLERVMPALGAPKTLIEDRLYGASSGDLLARLREVPSGTNSVMLIGHQPAIQELALELSGAGPELARVRAKFPTAALVTLRFGSEWNDLEPGSAEVVGYVKPKELAADRRAETREGGMSEREFDVVVIGAGAPGEVCAGRVADGGLEVAIVEHHLVGGECSYYACMPSKALLRPAEALGEVRRVPGAAEAVTGALDPAAALARRDEVIHELDDSGQLPWLEERSIVLFRGRGTLDGKRRVRVGDEELVARRAVVIATGSAAALPPIDGLADAEPWDNRDATTSKQVPERLIVLGGGPVGAEMAQAWRSLGAEAVLIEAMDRILPAEEPFASEQVTDALREAGVEVRTGARASSVRGKGGDVTVDLEGGDSVAGSELLVAVGRQARTGGIGLESVGVEVERWLEVDDQLRVGGSDWLYAVGDVTGRALLTHMGKYQARIAADNILGGEAAATSDRNGSPRVTFTDPQVAAVGYTLARAKEAGMNARGVDVPTSGTAGASFHGRNAPGTSRIVVDEDRRVIVGATFVGPETGEFLHAATIAVVGEVPLENLWHAVPAYPTRSEVWLKLMEEAGL